uniref:Guanylate cyclase 1 soluble subunit alpha 1 n=1 Tax=Oryctolagus cuniculus TaxID=9986 RepID=A0A5F9CAP9_RABIT
MFCTKLKDLKITAECPFSLLAPGQAPREPAEEAAGSSESCEATLPVCQDVPEKNAQAGLPQRKTSRSRVYLHTLAESICKLIFPEFERLNLALQRTLAKHKIKENRLQAAGPSQDRGHGLSRRRECESVCLTEALF